MYDVTVIVTTYNRPKLLGLCLSALSNQQTNNINFDVVVVDDYSQENNRHISKAICASYDNVTYYVNPKNLGLSASRNAGARLAKGILLLFLDDDIIVERSYVQGHSDIFKAFKNVATVGSLRFPPELCKKNNLVKYLNSRELRQRGLSDILLNNLETGQFGGGICGIRKLDFDRVGGFSEKFVRYGTEDVAMGSSLKQAGINLMYAADAKADHHDQVTIARYKAKTIESARYGLNMLLGQHPAALANANTKYLLPVQSSDPFNLRMLKMVVRIVFNRFMEKPLYFFANATNNYPILYSSILLHALFACWMIKGINKSADNDLRQSSVEYGE